MEQSMSVGGESVYFGTGDTFHRLPNVEDLEDYIQFLETKDAPTISSDDLKRELGL